LRPSISERHIFSSISASAFWSFTLLKHLGVGVLELYPVNLHVLEPPLGDLEHHPGNLSLLASSAFVFGGRVKA
jgi:hypothetical protein